MKFADYRKCDATDLAALIVKRQVSAKEVLETAIARAEQVNLSINAIIHMQYEQARRAVTHGLPQGPFSSVPFLIKDLGFFEPGEPATFGSSLFKDYVADHESAYVTRCKKAGLVFMGRSSTLPAGRRRLLPLASCPWRTQPMAVAQFVYRQRSAGSSASSHRAGAFPWHQTLVRDGAVCPLVTSSAAAYVTLRSCSIARQASSPAIPMPHRHPNTRLRNPSNARRASSESL